MKLTSEDCVIYKQVELILAGREGCVRERSSVRS